MIMLSVHKTQFKIILLWKITFCLLPGSSLSSPAPGLPHSASLSFYPPFLLATGSHRTDSGLTTGVVWDQNKAGHLLVAAPLPVLAFGGRERRVSILKKKNICTTDRLRFYKTIVLLKMSKGILISWIFTRSENLCLLQGLFQKGK